MPNRTPSFVVVGLVLIMFLLGFFYMSCSSTTAELRRTLVEFEERIRRLTIKNGENEKTIELLNTNKRELEEEKINIQKQMEKKDSEINDLNSKFNEKIAEMEGFKSDKQVLEEQLRELKNLTGALISKNFAIEKAQQEYDQQINDLKQQIENYKQQLNQSQEKSSLILNQRFQPILSLNETIQTNNIQKLEHLDQGQNNTDINNIENARKIANLNSIVHLNETNIANNQSQLLVNNQNNREQVYINKNDDKQNNQGHADLAQEA